MVGWWEIARELSLQAHTIAATAHASDIPNPEVALRQGLSAL